MTKKISQYELMMTVLDGKFISADIDNRLNYQNVQVLEKVMLPTNYIASQESYFDQDDCPQYLKIEAYIKRFLLLQNRYLNKISYRLETYYLNFYPKITIPITSNLYQNMITNNVINYPLQKKKTKKYLEHV